MWAASPTLTHQHKNPNKITFTTYQLACSTGTTSTDHTHTQHWRRKKKTGDRDLGKEWGGRHDWIRKQPRYSQGTLAITLASMPPLQWKMNKLIGGVEGLPWAGPWRHLWRPSVCPKPAVSLLNQHVSLEIYCHMESAHINTRPHTDTLTHTNIKEDPPTGAAKHASMRIYTNSCQDAMAQTKQILA